MTGDDLDEDRLDEPMIEAVIAEFYRRVRHDTVLGPVFNGAIADWDAHLGKLADFWSSVMLGSGRYKGNPVAAHLRQAAITPAMFDRWLSLWSGVTAELLPKAAAEALQARADLIAQSLKLALFTRLPEHPGREAE